MSPIRAADPYGHTYGRANETADGTSLLAVLVFQGWLSVRTSAAAEAMSSKDRLLDHPDLLPMLKGGRPTLTRPRVCFTGSVWRLLEPLRADDREAFLALARRRTFARNEVLCHEGDPADSLHLVEHGHLSVHGGLASGATATFTILSSGDYFGELALLRADRRRTATVTALEPSRTLAVAATAFDALCSRNPGIERILSALLADRIDILSRRLLETMYESLDRRVYRRLLELASSYRGSGNTATIPLSQTQLAGLVGATRPSVNQVLQRLADLHVVRLGRSRIEVLDLAALERRCRG